MKSSGCESFVAACLFSAIASSSPRNLVNDITFETDIRGTGAPELQAGDAARVIVNGHFTLRGRFQVH
jgi:hypothetical protein